MYRDVIVFVDEYLKNSLSSDEVIVRVPGVQSETLHWMWRMPPLLSPEKMSCFSWMKTQIRLQKIWILCILWSVAVSRVNFSLTEDGKAVSEGETVELEEMLKLLNVSN